MQLADTVEYRYMMSPLQYSASACTSCTHLQDVSDWEVHIAAGGGVVELGALKPKSNKPGPF
jgi:hypothetical protein